LGFINNYRADFLQQLEDDIACRHPLGLEAIAGVLGDAFGLEHPDNNFRCHLTLMIRLIPTVPSSRLSPFST